MEYIIEVIPKWNESFRESGMSSKHEFGQFQ